jgi:DNA-binding NtrC family response regulator
MWILETATMTDYKKTVLVVDDEPSFREVLKTALESWGYSVELAEDGAEGLSVYERSLPDLVLSDVVMPKLDGLGLVRVLKQKYPDSVVILFTAYASLANAIAAIREGAANLLTKPIDFGRLKDEIETLLERKPVPAPIPSEASQEFSLPSGSGSRPPEHNLTTMREQRPQGTFHNAGFTTFPGGRLSAPGPTHRGH